MAGTLLRAVDILNSFILHKKLFRQGTISSDFMGEERRHRATKRENWDLKRHRATKWEN